MGHREKAPQKQAKDGLSKTAPCEELLDFAQTRRSCSICDRLPQDLLRTVNTCFYKHHIKRGTIRRWLREKKGIEVGASALMRHFIEWQHGQEETEADSN